MAIFPQLQIIFIYQPDGARCLAQRGCFGVYAEAYSLSKVISSVSEIATRLIYFFFRATYIAIIIALVISSKKSETNETFHIFVWDIWMNSISSRRSELVSYGIMSESSWSISIVLLIRRDLPTLYIHSHITDSVSPAVYLTVSAIGSPIDRNICTHASPTHVTSIVDDSDLNDLYFW